MFMRHSPEIARIIQPCDQGPPEVRKYERRRDQRYPYRVTQMVAFHDEAASPTKDLLQPVRCHDISLSGISFFLAGPPKCEHCTLLLGRPPRLLFVKARVVHSEPTEDSPDTWIIGCEFVEKMDEFPLLEV
jgi:hypothetical protein